MTSVPFSHEVFSFPSSDGRSQVHAELWYPMGEVRAVLQISHGMMEYIGRYREFAEYLAAHGIAVCGNDHLGHGHTAASPDDLGYFAEPDGVACVIGDVHTLRGMLDERFPGIPHFLLGHSMGSFIARRYISLYGKGLSGAVIMGTGSQPGAVLVFGQALCRLMTLFKGAHHRSRLIARMVFGANNQRIKDPKTPNDWLTRDPDIVRKYINDPLCTFRFTLNGYGCLFRLISLIQTDTSVQKIPKDLPILLISGADDPVGAYGEGVRQVHRQYEAAGIQDITLDLRSGARHELLNETDREKVYADILEWIESRL